MKFIETKIPGLFEIHLKEHTDERGGFARAYCKEEFETAGISDFDPVSKQILSWKTQNTHTLRGMHYHQHPMERNPNLFRAVSGKAF
jgi:dTDP-4-dehydrorhamnose 3,5-epimerase